MKWKGEGFLHFVGGKSFCERIVAEHTMPTEKVNCFRANCLISEPRAENQVIITYHLQLLDIKK